MSVLESWYFIAVHWYDKLNNGVTKQRFLFSLFIQSFKCSIESLKNLDYTDNNTTFLSNPSW